MANIDSKKLCIPDISGEEFSSRIFKDKRFKELFLSFDRIHFYYKQNCWFIIPVTIVLYGKI